MMQEMWAAKTMASEPMLAPAPGIRRPSPSISDIGAGLFYQDDEYAD